MYVHKSVVRGDRSTRKIPRSKPVSCFPCANHAEFRTSFLGERSRGGVRPSSREAVALLIFGHRSAAASFFVREPRTRGRAILGWILKSIHPRRIRRRDRDSRREIEGAR
ncbi:hypothetical protein PUN28_010612 [Cardiocondyla obscurior]|uniref:Uncharacterized protein n=1 Tax=Cardiocondyla obscurior TaxID=286306 RepID=A0AAW2FGN7_9HYME